MEYTRGVDFEDYVIDVLKELGLGIIVIPKMLYSKELRKKTQIDVVFINKKRIYCIEVKSARMLKGSIESGKWLTSTSANRAGIKPIISPYRQNMMHILALKLKFYRKGLKIPKIENIIVVRDNARITTDCKNVYRLSNLKNRILDDLYYTSDDGEDIDVEKVAQVIRS